MLLLQILGVVEFGLDLLVERVEGERLEVFDLLVGQTLDVRI